VGSAGAVSGTAGTILLFLAGVLAGALALAPSAALRRRTGPPDLAPAGAPQLAFARPG
jgi:hypothetical protein